MRLVVALEKQELRGGAGAREAVIAQTGADPESVRLEVKENRKLTPEEIVEVVTRYEAGTSIRSLGKAFGLHEQTVRAHLRRQGVKLRPIRALTDEQEVEVARLYTTKVRSLVELAARFTVSQSAIRNVLVRLGVERRTAARRKGIS